MALPLNIANWLEQASSVSFPQDASVFPAKEALVARWRPSAIDCLER